MTQTTLLPLREGDAPDGIQASRAKKETLPALTSDWLSTSNAVRFELVQNVYKAQLLGERVSCVMVKQ